jgi:predicted nucleotidyltransferase
MESGAYRQTVIQRLQSRREDLERMGVRYLALFGSLARDEVRPDSDIDILVDLERPAGLLKHAQLENYLMALLEHDVDLMPRDSVRPQLQTRIAREARRVL